MSGTKIETRVDAKSADFAKNARQMVDRLTEIKNEEQRISQGGGAKAIEAQHKKGRMTARERIAKLIGASRPSRLISRTGAPRSLARLIARW